MNRKRPRLAALRWLRQRRRSLFGEILTWLLLPVLLLWPLAIAVTYVGARDSADSPYDRALASTLTLLTQEVRLLPDPAALTLSSATQALLRGDESDTMFYVVRGEGGKVLSGDRELPLPPNADRPLPGVIQYHDTQVRGFPVRVAYTWLDLRTEGGVPWLVQVAETLEKRGQLANHIVRTVVIPQVAILALAVLLVWFGLSRGIRPLNTLQARLRQRAPDDLSPIATQEVPSEILPLVRGMNHLLDRLAADIEAQRRFVADAAHQLKTPLAGLRTQAELALRTRDPDDVQRSLRHLVASSGRATHVVNQLLVMARAEAANRPPAPVDFAALAREQTLARIDDALAHSLDLGLEAPDHAVWVRGDATLLGELVQNLLDNALRYTPPSGTVTVRVGADPAQQQAFLEIDDSGCGISKEDRERVFDRFYRVLGNTAEGSGLGLAIAREIAMRHGGTLQIHDSPLVNTAKRPGTRVRLQLVLGPPPAAKP
ncbi:MAG: sensor histidine kinase N-terminal domain-containing protein [Pigmentiphaga sp.]